MWQFYRFTIFYPSVGSKQVSCSEMQPYWNQYWGRPSIRFSVCCCCEYGSERTRFQSDQVAFRVACTLWEQRSQIRVKFPLQDSVVSAH